MKKSKERYLKSLELTEYNSTLCDKTTESKNEQQTFPYPSNSDDEDDLSDVGILEGEEMWASEAIDTADEVQRWEGHELTPWWPVTEKPVRPGRYQVILGTWPFPSFAEYSKKTGWTDRGDKIEDVKSWRGLREPAE